MMRRRWLTSKESAQLDILRASPPQVFLAPGMTPHESAEWLEHMANAIRQNYRLQAKPVHQQGGKYARAKGKE